MNILRSCGLALTIGGATIAGLGGCELIATVDRSEIPGEGGGDASSSSGSTVTSTSSDASSSSSSGSSTTTSTSSSSTSSSGGMGGAGGTGGAGGMGGASSASSSSGGGGGGSTASSSSGIGGMGGGGASSSSSTGSSSSSVSSTASSSSGAGGGTGGAGGAGGNGGAGGGCAADEKACGGSCVSIDDPAFGCDPTDCTPCSAPHACEVAACDSATHACKPAEAADGTSCDDGNACTRTDKCQAGACVGSNPVSCSASDVCHVGACDPTNGACLNLNAPNGTSCNDGNACTQTDTCQLGVCVGASPIVCTALDACHAAGVCNAGTGVCTNPPANDGAPCSDGNACTKADVCTGGVCGGTAYACTPTGCQTSSTCDGNGGCTIVNKGVGVACTDDGNPCTSDACDGAGTCSHPSVGDGTSCGAGLLCAAGSCAADCFIGGVLIPSGTVNPANACQVCTPATSTTTWSNAGDGASCDDGDPDTTGDHCTGGACGGTLVPEVVTTTPQDGTTPIAGPTISVTFNTAMDPATLSAQTAAGACSGAIRVSLDGFNTCIAFASAAPVMSAGNTVATFTAAPGLLVNRLYKLSVASSAATPGGVQMAADYTTATGFQTVTPAAPVVQNESGSSLEANYGVMQFPTSSTGNVNDTVTMYGQIYEVFGGTQITGTGTQSAMISAQFGYAPANADGSPRSNPEYEAGWTWQNAIYNGQHYLDTHDGNDEYMLTLTLPPTGMYTYTYRFSLDGGASWTYADVAGAGSNGGLQPFDFNLLSHLKVN